MIALLHGFLAKLKDLFLARLFSLETQPALDEILRHLIEFLLLNKLFTFSGLNLPVALLHQIFNHESLTVDKTLRILRLV